MVNYAKGKIYKITSSKTDDVYIGSTCAPLSQRLGKHKTAMKMFDAGTGQREMSSFEILRRGDAVIVMIEDCPCRSKEQLFRRERFHIENTPNCVNRSVPGGTTVKKEADPAV